MRKYDVIYKIRTHAEEIRNQGVTALYLFGSTAQDQARTNSDVDFIYEYDATRFDGLDDVRFFNYLRDLLQCEVDLVSRKAIKNLAQFSPKIERIL